MTERVYTYMNDIGEPKAIRISTEEENDKCHFVIFSRRTGDVCGTGKASLKKIEEFINHYKAIKIKG